MKSILTLFLLLPTLSLAKVLICAEGAIKIRVSDNIQDLSNSWLDESITFEEGPLTQIVLATDGRWFLEKTEEIYYRFRLAVPSKLSTICPNQFQASYFIATRTQFIQEDTVCSCRKSLFK